MNSWRYRGDVAIADVAFEAWGATLEELFVAAADATTNAMSGDLEAIEDRQRRAIRVDEQAADLLLYRYLEELIYYKDAEGLLLRVPSVRVRGGDGGTLVLEAEAAGEPLDPRRHRLQADVKAAFTDLILVLDYKGLILDSKRGNLLPQILPGEISRRELRDVFPSMIVEKLESAL